VLNLSLATGAYQGKVGDSSDLTIGWIAGCQVLVMLMNELLRKTYRMAILQE
jgi:hypothetical protein